MLSAPPAAWASPPRPVEGTANASGSNAQTLGGTGTMCAQRVRAGHAAASRTIVTTRSRACRVISVVCRAGLDPRQDRRDLAVRQAAARGRIGGTAVRHAGGVIGDVLAQDLARE